MPYYVREKVRRTLNEHGRSLKGSKILIVGIAYKRDIEDWRESPALKVMDLLEEDQADVDYHDPFVPSFQDEHGRLRHSVPLTDAALQRADCAVIVTDHTDTDWEFVVRHANAVVDTRNATAAVKGSRDNVVLL